MKLASVSVAPRSGDRSGWLGRRLHRTGAFVAVVVIAAVAQLAVGSPARAETYVPISGAGSTWSQNALDQWARNVQQYGMKVNYQGTGSSDGRNQFKSGTVDYGVSEIPYGLSEGGVPDNPPTRKFAYMPIVAGGTAFMYNLKIGNQQVTNLRLSGDVLAKIFTNQITTWSDAAIKADNPGLTLPARKIVPVVRSDGSGTTAQLTTWLSKRYQTMWDAYCAKSGKRTAPCGVTSYYPVVPGSSFTAQSGSTGVAGYVAQPQSEGAITYVEYSYARNAGFPVVKMLNQAGYYIEPKAAAVAVGLTEAKINNDPNSSSYLTQDLSGVYVNPDKRAYPLSSYSYMIVPTETTAKFTTEKGKTLGRFGYYFLCEGQQQADALGYSPLPKTLVEAGFEQVRKIPGVVAQSIVIANCNNPTFSADGTNTLAKNAPNPQDCDKAGSAQCSTGTGGADKVSTPVHNGAGSTTSTTTGGGSTASGAAGAAAGSTGTGSATGTTSGGAAVIDPDTGQTIAGGDQAAAGGIAAIPVSLGTRGWGMSQTLMIVATLLLLGVTVVPPLLSQSLRRRRRS